MSVTLPWKRVLPPPEPPVADLLAESADRQQMAEAAAAQLYRTYLVERPRVAHAGSLDLIVFGPYRKASVEDADYGVGTC